MTFQTAYCVREYPLAPYSLPHLHLVNVFQVATCVTVPPAKLLSGRLPADQALMVAMPIMAPPPDSHAYLYISSMLLAFWGIKGVSR